MSKDDEGDSGNNSFTNKPSGKIHEFYLTGSVNEASEYVEWFNTIRHASADDTIQIYINSYGGDLFTAIEFVNVIQKTKAKVKMIVEGACLSAATVIFLQGHEFEIHPFSTFMVHTYTSGTFGKGNEMYDQISYEKNWSENIIRSVYDKFLTQEELNMVIEGKDLWLTPKEVTERMKNRNDT